MTSSPPSSSPGLWHQILHASWTWRVTWFYLIVFLFLPMAALVLKALTLNPAEIWRIATDPVAISTYNVTFFTALVASIINGFAGLIIAWVLVRYEFPGKRFLDAIIDLPFALPTAVAGLTLSTIYSTNGWIGGFLEPFGIKVSFTRLGVLVAMIFIALPFSVRTVQPVLQDMESEMEEAAWSMGASQWQTFWRVTLPSIKWSLLYGLILTNARAMGEFGAVTVVSGNIVGKTQTLPLFIEEAHIQYNTQAAYTASLLLACLAVVTLVLKYLLERRAGIQHRGH